MTVADARTPSAVLVFMWVWFGGEADGAVVPGFVLLVSLRCVQSEAGVPAPHRLQAAAVVNAATLWRGPTCYDHENDPGLV